LLRHFAITAVPNKTFFSYTSPLFLASSSPHSARRRKRRWNRRRRSAFVHEDCPWKALIVSLSWGVGPERTLTIVQFARSA